MGFDLIEDRYEEYLTKQDLIESNISRAEKLFRENYLD
jgi:hypothetical protein